MDPDSMTLLAMVGGPAGAAWVAVKTSVNGLRRDVREIKSDVKGIRGSVSRNGERIAELEGKHGEANRGK